MFSVPTVGKYFTAKTEEGIDMEFKVTDVDAKTCEVAMFAVDANTSGEITIPKFVNGLSVTNIGSSAFSNRSNLSSVKIPDSVSSIGSNAFLKCSSLSSVKIPDSVASIGSNAFSNCSNLTSVTIGKSVTAIGISAFGSCPLLVKCIVLAEEVPSASLAFDGINCQMGTLYVPEKSLEKYRNSKPYCDWGSIKTVEEYLLNGDVPEKCAAPTIEYAKGKLQITSSTAGAKCYYSIVCGDATELKETDGTILLDRTYTVTAYAKKEGYSTSETTTIVLTASELAGGDVDGNDELSVSDVTALVNKIIRK